MKGQEIDRVRELIKENSGLHPIDLGALVLRETTRDGERHCLLIPRIKTVDVREPNVPMTLATPEGTVGEPRLALPSDRHGWGKLIVRATKDPIAATWGIVAGDYNYPADRRVKGGAGVTNANVGSISAAGGWWYRSGHLQPISDPEIWKFIGDPANRHEVVGGVDVVSVDPSSVHDMPEDTADHGQHFYLKVPVEKMATYDIRAGQLADMVQGTDTRRGIGVWLIGPNGALSTLSAR